MGISCSILGHKPDRDSARHDGEDHWTHCSRCGTGLIRAESKWRAATADELAAHGENVDAKADLDSSAGL